MSSTSPVFGLVIPGRACRTDFNPTDASRMKYTMQIIDPTPWTISDIVFFLTSSDLLPHGHGAIVYWSLSSASNNNLADGGSGGFEILGAVLPDRPSGVFRTGWAQDAILQQQQQYQQQNTSIIITIGVSIEPISNIKNLDIMHKGVEDRLQVAKKIALDLYNYLTSFDDAAGKNGRVTVPTNVFERWFYRFEKKYQMDPNLFMKESV